MVAPKTTISPNRIIKSGDLRQRIYAVMVALGPIITGTGVISDTQWGNYLALGGALLSAGALILAVLNKSQPIDFSDVLTPAEPESELPTAINSTADAVSYREAFEKLRGDAQSGD